MLSIQPNVSWMGFFLPPLSLLLTHITSNLSPHKAAGKIPDFSPSTNNNGDISYSDNVGSDPDLCSWTISKCYGAHDIYTAPKNVIGISESTFRGLSQKERQTFADRFSL